MYQLYHFSGDEPSSTSLFIVKMHAVDCFSHLYSVISILLPHHLPLSSDCFTNIFESKVQAEISAEFI